MITVTVSPLVQNKHLPMLTGDPLLCEGLLPPSIDSMSIKKDMTIAPMKNIPIPTELVPRFSIQQESHIILNETFNDPNASFISENQIWADLLGTDSYDTSLYENTLIDPYNNAGEEDGASLFARIGNNGNDYGINNESEAIENLVELKVSNISTGWQLDFPVQDSYSMINISFKWRFDTPEDGFDDLDILEYNGEIIIMDGTPDFQEVRCRIEHPTEPTKSFWIGNPVTETNPNGTIFYRVGAEITQDEVWYTFHNSFRVDPESSNYTLELGAYLNTREYWNEYFDVWFDDILILGINDIPDTNPPKPIATGLDRTSNITEFNFWANFSEGTWETPIKNVTVFYNQSGAEYNKSMMSSLTYQPPSYVNNAGYNQTRWEFPAPFNFSDNISFYFIIFDYSNNSFVSEIQSTMIGDYTPPEITTMVINQLGNGIIIITINVTDWGYGVDTLVLNYTIDGEVHEPISITGSGTDFQADFTLNMSQFYGSTIEFGLSLNDTVAGNSDFVAGPTILAITDEVSPVIQDVIITQNASIEERTHITVTAEDPFGNIDEVYLVVRYENGTPHPDYSHVTLRETNESGVYKLPRLAGEAALKLPFSSTETYNITVLVRDGALPVSNKDSEIFFYEVEDIIAPKVRIEDFEYPQPGVLKIWVQANDLGSGIDKVILERKTKDGWVNYTEMEVRNNRYYATINTGLVGNEQIEFRINAIDNEGNYIRDPTKRPNKEITTTIFFGTLYGLILMEVIVVVAFVSVFATIKITQLQRLKSLRERRFEIALGRSERLAYLGEEAIFGFVAAYSQREGVSSILMWEPRLIGHFYQYLKELTDKANNSIAFIMQTRPQEHTTFIDFNIEKIGCTAHTFAYPVSTLPQQWLSTLTLDQVPLEGGQGTLLIMLIMREKWGEIANNFHEEIRDGVEELRDLISSGEEKQIILDKAREFRLFISGTLEVLDEIETETDEVSDEIMGDFEAEFLDESDEDSLVEEESDEDISGSIEDDFDTNDT